MEHFDKVIATDASAEQIASAATHSKIEYRVAPAESSGLENNSADLITVAQALHWFDIERFFYEATRTLKSGGVLAVWCYEHCQVASACDEIIMKIFDAVEDYWPPERDLVLNHYAGIELPMAKIDAEQFSMTANWTAEQMLGYVRTWSASQRHIKDKGTDPTKEYGGELAAVWGEDARQVNWPLTHRVGRQ